MAMNTYGNGTSESHDDNLRRMILDFIQNYVGNDPLEPYLRCIKWLKEMTPPGSVKVVLQEVLELAAKNFVPDKRYKSDLRFLKVWIQYADCCLERGWIFPYLEANEIGLEHGLFYEAYAMLLESSRDFSKADHIFQIGITRGAQPLERMIAMYNNFRSRMVARQKRKLRQEQEQKALLARLSGGAMRPLADNYGIEGLPILPSFQSNAREDPLLDMQDSGGGYGDPAPVRIGSKIYEGTELKAESSFEEERARQWIQRKPAQLPSATTYTTPLVSSNERVTPNSTHLISNEVHQTSNRPGAVLNTTHSKLTGLKDATSNVYFPGAPGIKSTTAQPMSARNGCAENVAMRPATMQHYNTSAHEYVVPSSAHKEILSNRAFTNEAGVEQASPHNDLLDDVSIVTKSVTDDILAMFGEPTLQTESRPPREQYASLPPAHQDVFNIGVSCINESKAGVGRAAQIDDVTVNTKSVTDDIMSMFSSPRNLPDTGKAYIRTELNNKSVERAEVLDDVTTSVTEDIMAMFNSGASCINESKAGARRAAQIDDVTVNTKSVTDDIMSMFSSPRNLPDIGKAYMGTELNYKSIDRAEVLDDVTTSGTDDIMAMFNGSPAPRPRVQTTKQSSMSFIRSLEGIPSQNGILRSPVGVVQNSPSSASPSDSACRTLNARADLKVMTSAIQQQPREVAGDVLGVQVLRNGTSSLQGTSPDLKSATVKQWVTKEIRSNAVVESLKAEIDVTQDFSNTRRRFIKEDSSLDDGNVRAIPSRKRSSWSSSVKDTQCIYISDEDEEVEKKKQRVQFTAIEGKEKGTPVVERSLVMRVKRHPSQYSPALGSGPIKNVPSSNGESFIPRNILEPTLSRTEHSKPGGQIYPWDQGLISNFLKDLNPPLSKYKGYVYSSKKYSGRVTLASLASTKSGVKNKPLELGSSKYQLKASTGHGAFAQVYLAETLNKTGDNRRVVLKVQKPPCPWEFYIYRQLDMRIPSEERFAYGCAQNIHIFTDCSFMECDFGQYGTLQDVINSYLSKGQRMDEPLCIFYTIEMLRMLEDLHKVGLIHGDFKPDNLLIRSSSVHLGFWAADKPGAWKQQGVCLIDWGRSIDLSLFAEGAEFVGDSKTDGFRCTEMIEKKPWTFQVDTYGLCGVAHCLLHGNYMEIEKHSTNATSQLTNRPKAPYKRYWNVNLWQNFFETLLNWTSDKSSDTLHKLRRSFEDYLGSDAGLTKKLRELLVKQTTMLLSRK